MAENFNFTSIKPKIDMTISTEYKTVQGIVSKLKIERDQVDVILLDLAKVFGKMPNDRLFYKLDYYGVRCHICRWINVLLGASESNKFTWHSPAAFSILAFHQLFLSESLETPCFPI